jgi:hypothetical protein
MLPRPQGCALWEMQHVSVSVAFGVPGIDPTIGLTISHELSDGQFRLMLRAQRLIHRIRGWWR